MSSLPVFLIDALPEEGAAAVLDGPEGRHAVAVRRLRPGEELMLSDGTGGLARCEVLDTGRDRMALRVLHRGRVPAPDLRVTVVQALIKGDRGELAVELATEAGVDAVVPWRAARCVAQWQDGPRGAKALARWRETARQASKQARRAWVPQITAAAGTAEVAELAAVATRCLVLHEGAAGPLSSDVLPDSGELLLVVGPEGGITEDELSELVEAGATPVRLGPSVLRASTAAAVALGAIGALSQRWQLHPSCDV